MKKNSKGNKTQKETKPKEKEVEKDSEEYYTKEEIELLDKYHDLTEHKFEDEEIYDIMQKCHNNDDLIKEELNEMIKQTLRGDEFLWQEVGKSN